MAGRRIDNQFSSTMFLPAFTNQVYDLSPRTVVSSSGDLVQAMRRGAIGATESFVRWSMGGGERTTAAPPTSQHALVNNEGRLNYACCEAGYVESAVRIPSIHSVRRFAR